MFDKDKSRIRSDQKTEKRSYNEGVAWKHVTNEKKLPNDIGNPRTRLTKSGDNPLPPGPKK